MENKKLSEVMDLISSTINRVFSEGMWIECEVASISRHAKSGHWYLELVELDDKGNEVCKVKASIWKAKASGIIDKFKNFTNSDLASGMKVLLNATPSFHAQYHLSFSINDIKPEFTLGGIEAKINQIVKELKEKNEFSKNKDLNTPLEFTRCAVVAPFEAAGLGDFRKEADILQKYNICHFDYFETVFQGKDAANGISEKIKEIFFSGVDYDALIIIRGGGSKTDLHFLNDIKIARYVARCPIPCFVGIGHERDTGVLDLIANKAFDTPSKVIEYVYSVVVKNANDINKSLALIEERSIQKINLFKSSVDLISEKIYSNVQLTVNKHLNDVEKINSVIREGANKKITAIKNTLNNDLTTIESSSHFLIEKTKTNIQTKTKEIMANSVNLVEKEKKAVLSNYGLVNAYRPSYIMDLGFTIIRKNNKILSEAENFKLHDEIEIESKNAIVKAKITELEIKGEKNEY